MYNKLFQYDLFDIKVKRKQKSYACIPLDLFLAN